jgi:hypothetical protein
LFVYGVKPLLALKEDTTLSAEIKFYLSRESMGRASYERVLDFLKTM